MILIIDWLIVTDWPAADCKSSEALQPEAWLCEVVSS
jgi:hypothetical protein